MAPFCPKCGASLPQDSNFCSKCGTPFLEAPPQLQWEYKEFEHTWPPGKRWAASTDSNSPYFGEPSLRRVMWDNLQTHFLPEIKKWIDEGWEPVTEVGPAGFHFRTFTGWNASPLGKAVVILLLLSVFGTLFGILLWAIMWGPRAEAVAFKVQMHRRDMAAVGASIKTKQHWRDYNTELLNLILRMARVSDFTARRHIFRGELSRAFEPDFFPSLYQLLGEMRKSPNNGDVIAAAIHAAVLMEIRNALDSSDPKLMSPAAIAAHLIVTPALAEIEASLQDIGDDASTMLSASEFGKSFVRMWPRIRETRGQFRAYWEALTIRAKERKEMNSPDGASDMEELADQWHRQGELFDSMINLLKLAESGEEDQEALQILVKLAEKDSGALMGIVSLLQDAFTEMNQEENAEKVVRAFTAVIMAK